MCPCLRSPAVGRRGGGDPLAADSGAGRWSALNSAHERRCWPMYPQHCTSDTVPVRVVGTQGWRGHTAALVQARPLPTSVPGLASSVPQLHQEWAQPCQRFRRDLAHRCHICAGTGQALPHLRLSSTHAAARTYAYARTRTRVRARAHTLTPTQTHAHTRALRSAQ